MEKIGQKTRNINFYSEKNGKMVCLHSRHARDYAKYLEAQSWVERYEAGQIGRASWRERVCQYV